MTSKLHLICNYCEDSIILNDMSEFFAEGWVELSVDWSEDEEMVLDFCSKECCYLFLEEEIGKGDIDE